MRQPRSMVEVCRVVTERLALKGLEVSPWNVSLAPALVEAWTDPAIARWNPVPAEPTLELAESWIRSTDGQNEASVGIDVVLTRRASADVVLAEVGLQIDPSQGIGEVGFWVSASQRGHGFGKAALSVAEELAAELELAGAVALVDSGNGAAIGLLQAAAWAEIPTTSTRRAFAHRVG